MFILHSHNLHYVLSTEGEFFSSSYFTFETKNPKEFITNQLVSMFLGRLST
jgi:hypothetical protein